MELSFKSVYKFKNATNKVGQFFSNIYNRVIGFVKRKEPITSKNIASKFENVDENLVEIESYVSSQKEYIKKFEEIKIKNENSKKDLKNINNKEEDIKNNSGLQ